MAGAASLEPALDQNLLPGGGPNEMQRTLYGTMMFNPRQVSFGLHAESSRNLYYFVTHRDNLVGKSLDLYGEYGRDEIDLLKQVEIMVT